MKRLLAAAENMAEMNPMLGLRGCRLGIVMPGLSAMQVSAIATATAVHKLLIMSQEYTQSVTISCGPNGDVY